MFSDFSKFSEILFFVYNILSNNYGVCLGVFQCIFQIQYVFSRGEVKDDHRVDLVALVLRAPDAASGGAAIAIGVLHPGQLSALRGVDPSLVLEEPKGLRQAARDPQKVRDGALGGGELGSRLPLTLTAMTGRLW